MKIQSISKPLNQAVDNISKFIKNNKVGMITTVVGGVGGAIKGATAGTGLKFSQAGASRLRKEAIKRGAIHGATNNISNVLLSNVVVKAVLDPDSLLDKTPVGKFLNDRIDSKANEIKEKINMIDTVIQYAGKLIESKFGGGSK